MILDFVTALRLLEHGKVWKTGDHLFATSDQAVGVEFDPVSLDTVGHGPPIQGPRPLGRRGTATRPSEELSCCAVQMTMAS